MSFASGDSQKYARFGVKATEMKEEFEVHDNSFEEIAHFQYAQASPDRKQKSEDVSLERSQEKELSDDLDEEMEAILKKKEYSPEILIESKSQTPGLPE